ncbi:hypothetical protein TorRG33x02_032440 [Trema orientale]|uniref:Reverse transcriptase, RNA-dependent DNA polymerase n=1 Tax=Trema orientale TaxID=63057 RepID=A0A2P5FTE8_TREOI|nr:hypothetical protein TorRG33x02_032440 [Trema orientale]
MEFAMLKRGIFISQCKYVLDLLSETGLLGCRATETPIEPNLRLQSAKPDELTNRDQFKLLIGKIIYLSHTRPDIAFTVSVVSEFMYSLGLEHYDAVCRILRYLKGTQGKGLLFENHRHL